MFSGQLLACVDCAGSLTDVPKPGASNMSGPNLHVVNWSHSSQRHYAVMVIKPLLGGSHSQIVLLYNARPQVLSCFNAGIWPEGTAGA
jgi:hypothetical protein